MKAVNLLPLELRSVPSVRGERPETKGGMGPFVVLGVLAALVAGVAGIVLSNNAIGAKQAELATATANQQAIQAQATKLKPYADFDAVATSRVATVKDLAGRRFDWEQAMRDLSRAIPAEVTLSSLSGDLGGASGGSGSPLRGAIAAPAIELQGCTSTQLAVSQLMSRLGDVDGVTRVSLAKSTKEKAAATTEGAAAPCGSGEKPNFDIVAFFEDAATKTASPGTATASTATATTPTATATPAAGATATATPTTTATTAGGTTP